jgi:ABC-type Zn uptake system ZnuABC Zn-binding protein ZnuA
VAERLESLRVPAEDLADGDHARHEHKPGDYVTSHDNLGYFAARYGFQVVGTALGVISTEVADPSAGAFAALVSEIRTAGVPAIFAENVSNPRLMQQLASAAGVTLIPDLVTDALTEPGTPAATYDGLMRHNVTRIVSALSR